ncbi:hypothetical protein LXA43DRAFT_1068598 [Ganoderma leucocontextum]|nr:hypothetical protein LXA43DRAFT_1068598 [Ganoderma leucocontextum]
MPGGGFSRLPPSLKAEDVPQDGWFTLGGFSIDEYKHIKVIVIGAGFSGILAGIRFPQKIPNVDLTIYEKSAGIGGTWYSNRYPGVACDVPAHCYQFTFAAKYKLMRYIKLSHEIMHAEYDELTGKWHIRLEEFEDIADVPLTAFAAITRWKLPDIPGIADYKGELHHTAGYQPSGRTWKSDLEKWKDKRVGVVGSGSTATQVVSALAPHVRSLANYVRGQTWLVSPFSLATVQDLLGRPSAAIEDDLRLQPEEIERFKSDLEYFDRVRHTLENSMNRESTMPEAEFQKMFRKIMEEKLAARPHIAAKYSQTEAKPRRAIPPLSAAPPVMLRPALVEAHALRVLEVTEVMLARLLTVLHSLANRATARVAAKLAPRRAFTGLDAPDMSATLPAEAQAHRQGNTRTPVLLPSAYGPYRH